MMHNLCIKPTDILIGSLADKINTPCDYIRPLAGVYYMLQDTLSFIIYGVTYATRL